MKSESGLPVNEQQRNYELLLEQSEKLVALLKENSEESVLEKVIKGRQETIEKIMKTDRKMKKAKDNQAPDVIAKLGTTLEKIIALDGESNKLLESSRSRLAKKITDMSKNVAVIKGYGPQRGKGTGKFISVRK